MIPLLSKAQRLTNQPGGELPETRTKLVPLSERGIVSSGNQLLRQQHQLQTTEDLTTRQNNSLKTELLSERWIDSLVGTKATGGGIGFQAGRVPYRSPKAHVSQTSAAKQAIPP